MSQRGLFGEPVTETDEPQLPLRFIKAGSVERVFLGERLLGWINRGQKTFTSPRNRKAHFFRNFAGFGLCEQLLTILWRQGITYVVLLLHDEGTKLIAETVTWKNRGVDYKHPDFEAQLILPEVNFRSEPL